MGGCFTGIWYQVLPAIPTNSAWPSLHGYAMSSTDVLGRR